MTTDPTPKGSKRRTVLLDAAQHVLTSSGGSQLTLRAVADEAGVRLGHLQYYFPSRSALLSALLDRVLAASLDRVALLTARPAGRGGDALLDGVLADHDDAALVQLFTEVWSMAAHDPEAATAVRSFYDQYAAHVAGFLQENAPELPTATARDRAEVFVMLMEGASLFRSGIVGRRSAGADAYLRHVVRTMLADGSRD